MIGAAWKGNLFTAPFPFSSFWPLLAALFFALIKGPVEESSAGEGWRYL
ncbi:MAG: hypothetical protein MZU91_02485 [Desulfosudis oleivorans]|nr:hypothetical protein [Desulfosudis oleivorans]